MSHIKWYNALQYMALCVTALLIPADWHNGSLSLWAMASVALFSVVKLVAERCDPHAAAHAAAPLDRMQRIGLWSIVAYWLVYVVGALFSYNRSWGWHLVGLKAVMVIMPLSVLLTDMRYLSHRALRLLLYCLVAGLLLRVLYCCGVAVGRLAGGASLASVLGAGFDSRHHAYSALYADASLAFLLFELLSFGHRGEPRLKGWGRALAWAAVALLIFYVVVVNSRAGIVALALVTFLVMADLAICRHRWLQALVLGACVGLYTFGLGQVLPGHADRVADTVQNLMSDTPADARIDITASAMETAMEAPLTGLGPGDYQAELSQKYADNGFEYGLEKEFNAHNQYLESMLAVGIFALIPLLAMLILPALRSLKRAAVRLLVWSITAVLAANLLFESMLERQMGLQFYALMLVFITLAISAKKNNFAQ